MISPDNLSIEQLRDALVQADVKSADIDENGCLKVRVHDQTFVVAVIGPHQVRFFRPSAVAPRHIGNEAALLSAANSLNSDLAFIGGAYVSEEGDLIFTRALTVSGGVSEWNVATALLEFALEAAIFDQLVEKALGGTDV
ncbi:YbjN domain-containing protein [Caldimonas taiwanensis]|uniref:YbjN domain-containing protein n=1 Tax=Caldimonas taiwanensis TaxID=307483 RepID=UPI0007817726